MKLIWGTILDCPYKSLNAAQGIMLKAFFQLWPQDKLFHCFNLKNGSSKYVSVNHLVVSNSATPWTVVHQAPPYMGFSRQEYWRGLPLPSPGYLPNTGIEPRSPSFQADSLPYEPWGKAQILKGGFYKLGCEEELWAIIPSLKKNSLC